MENDPNNYGPPPASKAAISKLKKRNIKEFVGQKTECSVCLMVIGDISEEEIEKLKNPDIVEMPCDHTFHHQCILPWLDQHNSCPQCRFELPTDDQDYE